MRVDLHCHSTASDGSLAPEEVAVRAHARTVELFALTDHDTCAGTPACIPVGAKVVRGVELSCRAGDVNVHLLCYDRGGAWDVLEEAMTAGRAARRRRVVSMAARLGQRGIKLDVTPLLALAEQRAIGRPDLAAAMVEAGVVATKKDAFTRFLYDGGPVDVPHDHLTFEQALALGQRANAAMSLAHPHQLRGHLPTVLQAGVAGGLGGLECHYGPYNPGDRQHYAAMAKRFGLVATGGSDFHTDGDPAHGIDFDAASSQALSTWLGL